MIIFLMRKTDNSKTSLMNIHEVDFLQQKSPYSSIEQNITFQ